MKRLNFLGVVGMVLATAVAASCSKNAGGRRCAGDACHAPAGAGGASGESGAGAAAQAGMVADAGSDAMDIDPEDVKLGVRFEDGDDMALDVVTLACGGDCVEIEAVVRGGNPPYAIEWDDGSTESVRRVCPDSPEELSVRATDTPIDVEEFSYEGQTLTASVETRVLECTDGGTCEPGAGPDTPDPGHYEGTGSYVCDNDMSMESAALINYLAVSLQLDIDPSTEAQPGRAFFQWGLIVIAGDGVLDGTLECGGALRATLREGTWGLPGPEPMTVVPTGTVTGEFTARRTGDGTITGSWHWTSMSAVGDYGNMCNGTYEAELKAP